MRQMESALFCILSRLDSGQNRLMKNRASRAIAKIHKIKGLSTTIATIAAVYFHASNWSAGFAAALATPAAFWGG